MPPSIPELLIVPPKRPSTRILFVARHAPQEPDYSCRAFPGDGGYPAYYRRIWEALTEIGYPVTTANDGLAPLRAKGEVDLVFSLYNRMPIKGGIITEDLKRSDPLGYELFEGGPIESDLSDDVAAPWRAAGPMDYFRLDYRFDPDTGRRIFLEFNICCHIGRSGAICLAASQWGLSQTDLLGHVIEYSLRRQASNRGRHA